MLQDRVCKTCNIKFIGGPGAYYCPECRHKRRLESYKRHRQNKKNGKIRSIGSMDICEKCGGQYAVMGGLQRYCKKCAEELRLKKDRERALEYYVKNKDVINPRRNARRRIIKYCKVCKKRFRPHGAQTICSNCNKKATE